MMPVGQEKGQAGSLIDKVNFGIGCLLIDNQADPILPEKQKIEPQMNNIARLATIEPNNLNGRKGRTKPVEQVAVEPLPDSRKRLVDTGFEE